MSEGLGRIRLLVKSVLFVGRAQDDAPTSRASREAVSCIELPRRGGFVPKDLPPQVHDGV